MTGLSVWLPWWLVQLIEIINIPSLQSVETSYILVDGNFSLLMYCWWSRWAGGGRGGGWTVFTWLPATRCSVVIWTSPGQHCKLNSKTPPAPLLYYFIQAASTLHEFKRNVRLNYYLLECGTHWLCRDQNWSKTRLKARPARGCGEERHLATPGSSQEEDHSRGVRVMSSLMGAIRAGWIISSSGGRNGWEMKLIFRRITLATLPVSRVPAERAWTKWGNERGRD